MVHRGPHLHVGESKRIGETTVVRLQDYWFAFMDARVVVDYGLLGEVTRYLGAMKPLLRSNSSWIWIMRGPFAI
jgi:hypothetical protein